VRWVAWIPVGERKADEGAVVGPEWLCRQKAGNWIMADPEHIPEAYLAPISEEVVTVMIEHGVVTFSDED
jgi:hypothetical protein